MKNCLFLFIGLIFCNRIFATDPPIENKPNIIFILTDDQRWDALGYAGNKLISTPEMDRLAREGVYFKNSVVTTPICAASRASILSGMHERAHRYTFQTGDIRPDFMEEAYPKLLKDKGYYTGFFGKFGVKYKQLNKLFNEYEDYDRNGQFSDKRGYFYKTIGKDTVHLTRYTGQQALDFIEKAPADKPFCLSLSFSAPHAHDPAPDQYFWQKETDHLLENETMPDPKLADDSFFNILPDFVKKGFNRLRWTWRYDTPAKYQHSVKGYYRMISGIDMEIAKIRQQLAQKGIDKNTIIILMGDNGYFLGERQLAGKWLLYDNSIRVPLIIYDPRNGIHRDLNQLALNIDVPATILDFAGVESPKSWQGKSLTHLVSGENTVWKRDTVLIEHLWEFENIPPSEGVKTLDWKYFRYVNDKKTEELYDLKADPDETKNLASDQNFKDKLIAFRSATDRLAKQNSGNGNLPPFGLTTDFIRQPSHVKLVDSTPDFSWNVPVSAISQSAYQILVSPSKSSLENNEGDIWNSGQIKENNNSDVKYGGKRLVSRQKYFWKVRIWDYLNRLSDYSEIQEFTLAANANEGTTSNFFQIDKIAPVEFIKKENNTYFIDFGKDAFANMQITYTARKKEILSIRIGEQLVNGQINRNPEGHIRYQQILLPVEKGKHSYLLPIKPDERNTKPGAVAMPDSFPVLLPFRYCEIDGVKSILNASDVHQLAYHSYFEDNQSQFASSDSVLNQIWDLCKYSIKATTFGGLYVDGDRERIPYEADAYLNQLSHYSVDKEYAIARKTIEYFMEHPTWPTEWQLHVAMMFYQDYMYTGNTDLIEKYYDQLKYKTLMELSREDGLISSKSEKNTPEFMQNLGFKDPKIELKDIVDWPPAQKDTGWKLATAEGERDGYVFMPINTMVNAFFYKNMVIMADFARILHKTEDELQYQSMATEVKQAMNNKLFDKKQGAYVDGEGTDHASLHANMTALAFGAVPDSRKKSVVDFIKTRGMACSVYGAQYLMEALYEAGAADYALQLLTDTGERSWYNMIRIGSTITLEAWDMKYKPNSDWNHAWGAVPANIITRNLWGIQPKIPGGGIISIKPQLGDLKSSNIEVPFLKGNVIADYKRINKNRQVFHFQLPGNVYGELSLDNISNYSILLNGEQVNTSFDTIRLSPGENTIELLVNTF